MRRTVRILNRKFNDLDALLCKKGNINDLRSKIMEIKQGLISFGNDFDVLFQGFFLLYK